MELRLLTEAMDADQAAFTFPMWSNVNMPALAMRLVAARDEEHALLVVQTIAMHLDGDAVQRMWNVYRTWGSSGSDFPFDFLTSCSERPEAVTLGAKQETRVARTARRSIPDASPEDLETFLAFARAIEAARGKWFVRDREVLGRFGRPGMRIVARYRDWPELDLLNEQLPSASPFFQKVLSVL